MGRGRAGRRHTGNDFVGDAGRCQRVQLFLEPAEYPSIAALQPNDGCSRRGTVDQEPADMLLPRRGPSGTLADRDKVGTLADVIEHDARGEIVVEHDVSGTQTCGGFQGQ
jgi:hypothetical protein